MTDNNRTRLEILRRTLAGPFRMTLRAVVLTALAPVGVALSIRMVLSDRTLRSMAWVLFKRSFMSPAQAWLLVPLHVLTTTVTVPFVLLGFLASQVGLGSASAAMGSTVGAALTFILAPGLHVHDALAVAAVASIVCSSLIYVISHYLASKADEGDE